MILIIGGGIAGLTTAIALQQKGIDFLVVEAVPEIKAQGAGISLAGNAMLVLEKLGLDQEVKHKGHLIYEMKIQDPGGKNISVMDADKLGKSLGLENVAIHRGALHEILLAQIEASKVLTNKRAISFSNMQDGVTMYFQDGTSIVANGVIVADGIHSIIRKTLIPDALPRYAGYTCWRGVVENHWNISHEAVETWGSKGRFGYVPIGDNKVYWFACKNAPKEDSVMKHWTSRDLVNNFSLFAKPIPDMIANTPADKILWNDIYDIKPLQQIAFNKVLLIGDAGHATTPNLGQGACMGMEDALAIADELSQHEVLIAFNNFQQRRLKRLHFIVNTSYNLGKIAQLENKFLIAIRNALIRATPEAVNKRQAAKVLGIS